MSNWLKFSLTRKIGGLSAILLSFLFLVIVYSVYKLQQIDLEMREVAEVDIPLTEVIANVERLQLTQHILMEKVRLSMFNTNTSSDYAPSLLDEFNGYSQKLNDQLNKAVNIIQDGMKNDRVRLKLTEHHSVIKVLQDLQVARLNFEQQFTIAINAHSGPPNWQNIEQQDDEIDKQVSQLLQQLENLTLEVAKYAEKHEQEFMLVNAVLGISGLCIGIYLTLYIIQSFRHRIGALQGQVQVLSHSIKGVNSSTHKKNSQHQDELSDLEHELEQMMDRLSQDLVDREEVQQHLLELATRDKLTNAYNRHKWDEQIEVEIKLAARGSALSLLILDVDHFKKINDTYGHDTGDDVLRLLVNSLRQRLRATDHIFRLGGEEFAILLRNIDQDDAFNTAEALRQHISVGTENDLPTFTVSIGVASFAVNDDADSLFKRADNALYRAKQTGRNRVVV
ncbi:GGDEF domain-containing protein [Neptunicella sp. SCSIO 80796]|uniref:GGDEF domain-containing protein n=1 Tax=Neptunicella plasticusilytica TaxID=3117012 RepID=UPI003A4E59EF